MLLEKNKLLLATRHEKTKHFFTKTIRWHLRNSYFCSDENEI